MLVTVLTATYNRMNCIDNLYRSLLRQTRRDFQWLVIDDGSTDGTEEYFRGLVNSEGMIIEYHKKPNGGKHTALNYAHPYIKGELVFMVDSDDYLVDDAIETVICDWENDRADNICGPSYMKQTTDGKMLSRANKQNVYIADDIEYRINKNIEGDRCEIVRSDLFRRFPFPEFPGERFMSEGWLFRKMAINGYKTAYRNKVLYICEYLEGGLSKSGRALRMKCPLGMMENCKSFLVPNVVLKVQCKEMVLLWVYGLCAGKKMKDIVAFSGRPYIMRLVQPFGYILYRTWKKKYED